MWITSYERPPIVVWIGVALLVALAPQAPRDGGCVEWRDCRQLALAAADRGDYETFHDLAWRAIQTGPRNDPALMYLLARAQALSGRPHDALVMLQRLAEMGVPSDAEINDDFRRTRQLPGWAEVSARIARLTPAPAIASPLTPNSASPPGPPTAPLPEAVRFAASEFAPGGLAYDAVSDRFLFGDRLGRKLFVVSKGANHAVDFVRADSAGFHEIAAIEIDSKRGDLWVISTAPADGSGTLHKLQLVSGRPLKSFRVAADLGPVALVDLAVTAAGVVLVLDSTGGQLLALRPGAASLERIVRIGTGQPVSLAAGGDEGTAYVADRDGVSRIDLRARTATRITTPTSISLAHLERIRWNDHALVVIRADDDGSRRIVRLALSANGRAITNATTIGGSLPANAQTSMTIVGNEVIYLATPSHGAPGPAEFVAYRVRLR